MTIIASSNLLFFGRLIGEFTITVRHDPFRTDTSTRPSLHWHPLIVRCCRSWCCRVTPVHTVFHFFRLKNLVSMTKFEFFLEFFILSPEHVSCSKNERRSTDFETDVETYAERVPSPLSHFNPQNCIEATLERRIGCSDWLILHVLLNQGFVSIVIK